MAGLQAVVAVVHANGDTTAIWHVDIGPDIGLGRLCGAWVLQCDDTTRTELLTRGRYILATDASRRIIDDTIVDIAGHIDIAATLTAVIDEISALQAAFEAEPRPKGRKLVEPDWPTLPALYNETALAASGDSDTAVAHGIGRWLADLAISWQRIESQRLARTFLIDLGGKKPRMMPVVVPGPRPSVAPGGAGVSPGVPAGASGL